MSLMLVLQVIMADLCAEEIDKIKKHGKCYASRLNLFFLDDAFTFIPNLTIFDSIASAQDSTL